MQTNLTYKNSWYSNEFNSWRFQHSFAKNVRRRRIFLSNYFLRWRFSNPPNGADSSSVFSWFSFEVQPSRDSSRMKRNLFLLIVFCLFQLRPIFCCTIFRNGVANSANEGSLPTQLKTRYCHCSWHSLRKLVTRGRIHNTSFSSSVMNGSSKIEYL